MNGISVVSIELTSKCNKDCWMCGRRKLEREEINYSRTFGDMDFDLFRKIAKQIDPGVVVQLHWNGEPSLYWNLEEAVTILKRCGKYVSCNTNGLLLGMHWKAFLQFDSFAVSVIENDSLENYKEQLFQLKHFMDLTEGCRRPLIVIRELGNVPTWFREVEGVVVATRTLHAPEMSNKYRKPPTIPEVGVCQDLLHHIAIDRHGYVFPCVRMNPRGLNCIGKVGDYETLFDIINGKERNAIIAKHFNGLRKEVELCKDCDFYGCPTSR